MGLLELGLHVVLVFGVQVEVDLVVVCGADMVSTLLVEITKLKMDGRLLGCEFEEQL